MSIVPVPICVGGTQLVLYQFDSEWVVIGIPHVGKCHRGFWGEFLFLLVNLYFFFTKKLFQSLVNLTFSFEVEYMKFRSLM
ncbi:hypothetical protein ABD73_16495 [Brevibacillus laterosporus]|nr:hypothetical protein [Brevibacillus laterosporus]